MSSYDDYTPEEGIRNFFVDTLRTDQFGYLHLACSDPSRKDHWENQVFSWPERCNDAVEWCQARDAESMNVYFAPALFDMQKYDANPKFIKENLLGSFVNWAEYDGDAPRLPALDATESDATPDVGSSANLASEAVSVADTPQGSDVRIPPASRIIQSGFDGFQHRYWDSVDFQTDINAIEQRNRSITYATRADTSGWDATQVLRVPFTHNYKYAEKPPVTVMYVTNFEYTPAAFAHIPKVEELISLQIDENNLPSVDGILLRYAWPSDVSTHFLQAKVDEGKRSSALMKIGHDCAEMGLTESEIYAMIKHADDRWGKYVKRSDRKKRLLDIVNRALTQHPIPLSKMKFEGLKGVKPNVETDDGVSIIDFADSEEEIIDWTIPGLLEHQAIGIVASSPGVGKTQLSLQLAYCCAIGIPFLHWEIPKPMKVMVFSLEMPKSSLKMFVTSQLKAFRANQQHEKLLNDNFRIFPRGRVLSIANPASQAYIVRQVERFQPQLIIFDSLGKLTNTKLDEETTRRINNFLGEIKTIFDCSIWLIHHQRKSNENNRHATELDDVHGSTFITADASAVLVLERPKASKNQIYLHTVKLRTAEMLDPIQLTRDTNLLYYETNNNSVPVIIGGDNGKDGGSNIPRPSNIPDGGM